MTTCVSLFSGGGGVDFALKDLGVEVIYNNDICRVASATLRKYFPESDVVCGDIREISSFPAADMLVGGYPCQSFSLAGLRKPSNDPRTYLFQEFARALSLIRPKYFIAENVSGMAGVESGVWFREQLNLYSDLGYNVTHQLLKAQEYGVPQSRKRIFIVGVRKDLDAFYRFPARTHGSPTEVKRYGLAPYTSHGDVIRHLPLWPTGEFYERPHDPSGHMSWYYMSRNRKAAWAGPSFCIVANFRHITLHPASQTMKCVWSNLADGFKQKWEFTGEYEHLDADPTRPILEVARRLSWREAAAIQTFPDGYEPEGDLAKKFEQIGNAVPPALFKIVAKGILDGTGLVPVSSNFSQQAAEQGDLFRLQLAS